MSVWDSILEPTGIEIVDKGEKNRTWILGNEPYWEICRKRFRWWIHPDVLRNKNKKMHRVAIIPGPSCSHLIQEIKIVSDRVMKINNLF